jgi:hypothetical protein
VVVADLGFVDDICGGTSAEDVEEDLGLVVVLLLLLPLLLVVVAFTGRRGGRGGA